MMRSRTFVMVAVAAAFGGLAGVVLSRKVLLGDITAVVQPLWVCLALFCGFSLYWTYAAKNSSTDQSGEPWASTILHQVLFNGALLFLFFRVPGLTGRWLPRLWWLMPAGILIQASALGLAIWARRHLGTNWSAAVVAKVDHQLIQTGPYRVIRHPIYTAMLGNHLGIAIASGEWHALVGLAMLALAYVRKINLEEQIMQRTFGAEHAAYRQSSWALIPWVL